MRFRTIEWKGDRVRILDQRKLPQEVSSIDCKDGSAVAEAIRAMAIRGAPAIGVAAAFGIALEGKIIRTSNPQIFRKKMAAISEVLGKTRPTAVNLFWALDRMKRVWGPSPGFNDVEAMKARLETEALQIYREDIEVNQRIGRNGHILIQDGDGILTHCNAGGLATAGHGTALSVIYEAWREGKRFKVYVDETRPMLQGARLTAWELIQEKIPVTVLTDNMAAWLMRSGKIALVLVGADRIARNGDTANKIGTYSLAIVSQWHRVPFYVAAPTSTLDLTLASGLGIPIEERSPKEVTHLGGKPICPERAKAFNPAFDVTPHFLIRGIITEKGIARKPFQRELRRIKDR